MCEVLIAAEDPYFEHLCNYSTFDLVKANTGTHQHSALTLGNCVTATTHIMKAEYQL
jgi:hypothetical protein